MSGNSATTAPENRRIAIVADEMLGYTRTGGLGTATTFLALALGRMGHRVQFFYLGEPPKEAMSPEWTRMYEAAGVRISVLKRSGEKVEPAYFGRARDVERALAAEPADVVITQDLAAPAYTTLRTRHLGLGFEKPLFVAYCHGGRRWITDMARKVRVLPGAHAVTLLEQASVELADVVVSPSAYLLDWMREQGWRLPNRSLVIPYLTRSVATGEPAPRAASDGPVERIAFFGRLEDRKGLRPFAAGVNALDPDLLQPLELEFVGAATPAWPPDRVEGLFSERTKGALRRISFATDLDQNDALARLARRGTLAVMTSLEDNSPNTVYECLERGIPFIASRMGGTVELIASDDRGRVLFEPTADGVAAALRRALVPSDALRPARPAFDSGTAYAQWADVVELKPGVRAHVSEQTKVDVVVRGASKGDASVCLSALRRQTYRAFATHEATTRQTDLDAASADWIAFLEHDDVPDDDFLETLVRAQAASGADVVTCGVRLEPGGERLFHGEPGGLGLVANHYGTAALIRRSSIPAAAAASAAEHDPDWPLLAGLSVEGAQIVSVPRALITRRKPPGDVEHDPAAALLVLQKFERRLPDRLRALPRLAAGLAASTAQQRVPRTSLGRRLLGLRRKR